MTGVLPLLAIENSPLVAEKIAIDASNALRSAEAGLRGFSSRRFPTRLLEAVTGRTEARLGVAGFDMVTAQRAMLEMIQWVMAEGIQTNGTIRRVIDNLEGVDAELEEIQTRIRHIEQQLEAIRREIVAERLLRHLAQRYAADALYRGCGELLGSALYIAHVVRLASESSPEFVRVERQTAVSAVHQRLARDIPLPTDGLLLHAAQAARGADPELAAYALEPIAGAPADAPVAAAMVRWITAPDPVGGSGEAAWRVFRKARANAAPDAPLARHLLYPHEFCDALADEVLRTLP